MEHPDGSLYFHKSFQGDEGSCVSANTVIFPDRWAALTYLAQSIFTEAYLHNKVMLDEVTLLVRYIWEHAGGIIKSEGYEVVVNVELDSDYDNFIWRYGSPVTRTLLLTIDSYYFIDHVHRMPCWMRPYNPSSSMLTTESLGASSPDHFRA